MKFKPLAELFTKLSSTSKRLELTRILEEFYKKTDCASIGFIVQLCMGRVFPPSDSRELGIANNMMIDALAITGGISTESVKESSSTNISSVSVNV